MLNINKSIEYSLIAIKHIKSKSNKLCSANEIANQYNIPKEILAKILQRLSKCGYLNSIKGSNGGYSLNKNLEKINLIDFIETIEGPIGTVKCNLKLDCNIYDICNIKNPMNMINNNIRNSLKKLKIYDLTN